MMALALRGVVPLLVPLPADRPAPPRVAPSEAQARARLEALFDAHYDAVFRIVRRLGVPDGDADDAVQRVFLVAARRLDEVEEGRERAWLAGVASRTASELRRRAPARRELPVGDAPERSSETPGPEDLLLARERLEELDAILLGMTDDLRSVLVLSELEGCTAAEVAAALGIPAGTVASRLRRAREALDAGARRARARREGGAR